MGGVDLRWEFGGSGDIAKTCYHRDWSFSFRVYVVTSSFLIYIVRSLLGYLLPTGSDTRIVLGKE